VLVRPSKAAQGCSVCCAVHQHWHAGHTAPVDAPLPRRALTALLLLLLPLLLLGLLPLLILLLPLLLLVWCSWLLACCCVLRQHPAVLPHWALQHNAPGAVLALRWVAQGRLDETHACGG
jgi:hypothetical protein